MSQAVLVQIIGSPIACKEGVKDSWRDVAAWAADKLKVRFGQSVELRYFDLFDIDCPPMSADAKLPLVIVGAKVVSNGGKISIPAIEREIESIMQRQAA
jgi:disulfide oxidoreductase YuzD